MINTKALDQQKYLVGSLNPEDAGNPDESYLSIESEERLDEDNQDTEQVKPTKLIRITRPFRTRWDLFTMLLAVYTCFTVPFFIAFSGDSSVLFFVLNTLVDLIFLVDIYLNFRTTFIDGNGEEVQDPKVIFNHYLKGRFAIDMIASFPIDNFILMFGELNTGSETLQATDMLKMLRILRLGKIIRFIRTSDDLKAIMKLCQLTLYVILWVHLTGCFWYLVVRDAEEWVPVPDFLTGTTTLYEDDVWRQYFTSFYHGVWLLTGGEVAPRNAFEAMLASILIIMGALITAVLFGEMAVLMSNLNKKENEFQEILNGALTTMNNMNLPDNEISEILDYLTQTQNSLSVQEQYETFEKFISPSLLQQVSAHIYSPVISKNCILQCYDSRVQNHIQQKLKNKFTKPEEVIISEGTSAESLFFLVDGECKVHVSNRHQVPELVCYLMPGCHFGEIGIVYDTLRTATVEGVEYCQIAELTKEDYKELTNTFSDLDSKFRTKTEVYTDDWKRFLSASLGLTSYFERLNSSSFNDLIYSLRITPLERGSYLFRPGDTLDKLYILAHGELELSITINDKHLHLIKRDEGYSDMENSPGIPRQQTTLQDYFEYRLNISEFFALKHKAEIMPIMNDRSVIGFVGLEEDPPEDCATIGDYPQEIVLANIRQGCLLNRLLALKGVSAQFQCKAVKNSTIYALSADQVESLCRKYSDLETLINDDIKSMDTGERPLAVNHLDYIHLEELTEEEEMLKLWKHYITSFIVHSREQKRKSGTQIPSMVPKLQAVIACEEAENFDLAVQVSSGLIPPHHIRPDGSLDPNASSFEHKSLSTRHPIIKAFNEIFSFIRAPGGVIVTNYQDLQDKIKQQAAQMEEFKNELSHLKLKLQKFAETGRPLPKLGGPIPPSEPREESKRLSSQMPPSAPQRTWPEPVQEEPAPVEFDIDSPVESPKPAARAEEEEKQPPRVNKDLLRLDIQKVHEAQERRRQRREARKEKSPAQRSPPPPY